MKIKTSSKRFFLLLSITVLFICMTTSALASSTGKYDSWAEAAEAAVEDTDYAIDDSKYTIYTAEGLAWFAAKVNSGTTFVDCTVTLANDINLDDGTIANYGGEGNTMTGTVNWTPIGSAVRSSFKGTFDGADHKVSGVYIDNSTADFQGLFGYMVSGTIKNLGVVDSSIIGDEKVAGIVAYASTSCTIEKCYNTGDISGTYSVGGIVAYAYNGCTIEKCYNTGDISGANNVGGIVGYSGTFVETNPFYITNCYNTGSITGYNSSNDTYIGGVAGYAVGYYGLYYVTNCYNTGDVTGTVTGTATFVCVGGVTGYLDSVKMTNCSNSGNVLSTATSSNGYTGGITGYVDDSSTYSSTNPPAISNCTNTGDVTGYVTEGNDKAAYVGGIFGVGEYVTEVSNCNNSGTITAKNDVNSAYVGGLIGQAFVRGEILELTNCYNTGGVIGTGKNNTYTGGLLGHSYGNSTSLYAKINNCYTTGDVTATSTSGGVFVGGTIGFASYTTLEYCYNMGNVISSGNTIYSEGMVGYTYNTTVTNCYYNRDNITGDLTMSNGGTALTTLTMTGTGTDRAEDSMSRFDSSAWTFTADATIDDAIILTYPVLTSNIQEPAPAVTIEVIMEDWTYGDTASTPSITTDLAYTAVAYSYCDTEEGEYIDQQPTNVGDYYIKATVTVGSTDIVSDAIAFIIKRGTITVTPDSEQNKDYGQTDEILTYTYTGGLESETPSFTGELVREAGESSGSYAITLGTLALEDNGDFIAINYTLVLDETTVNYTINEEEVNEDPEEDESQGNRSVVVEGTADMNVSLGDNIFETVFTPNDLKSTEDLQVVLTVDEVVMEDLDEEEQILITETIEALANEELAFMVNLSLSKWIGDEETPMYELSDVITITIDIPEEYQAEGRVFSIVRVHEGRVTVLEDLDDDDTTITFETHLFSTYAVSYTSEVAAEAEDKVEDKVEDEAIDEGNDSSAVDTGDNSSSQVLIVIMIVSLLGIFVIERKRLAR